MKVQNLNQVKLKVPLEEYIGKEGSYFKSVAFISIAPVHNKFFFKALYKNNLISQIYSN